MKKEIFQKLKNNKEFHLIFFNIITALVYWSWEPLTEELIGHPIQDETRISVLFVAIFLHVLSWNKFISLHTVGLFLQMFVITHYGYTMFSNNYHYVYIVGYTLVLVLQSLTFKEKYHLFLFYLYSFLVSSFFALIATENQKLFIYNVSTVLILGPIAAMIRIRGDELIIKQKNEINDLKIEQMNNKIQQNLSNVSSTLSHEINTPLTTILGYTEVLHFKKKHNQEIDDKSLQKIEDQVNKIKSITDMLGLLSSDPKKSQNEAVCSCIEIKNYINNFIKPKFYLTLVDFNFSILSEYFEFKKSHMFYVLNEIFDLFPKSHSKNYNIFIDFSKNKIRILTETDVILAINDLTKMTAQIVASNNDFCFKYIKEDNKHGIELYKN